MSRTPLREKLGPLARPRVEPDARKAMTPKRRAEAFLACGAYCAWCGKKITDGRYEVDHRVSLFKGGHDILDNLDCLHPACHADKTAGLDAPDHGKIRRIHKTEDGTETPRRPIEGRGFDQTLTRGLDGKVKPKRGGGSATPHSGGSGRLLNENKGSDQ